MMEEFNDYIIVPASCKKRNTPSSVQLVFDKHSLELKAIRCDYYTPRLDGCYCTRNPNRSQRCIQEEIEFIRFGK